jgi:hypothetical protein
MSAVDKQRIAAVQALEAMGFRFDGTQWLGPGYAFAPRPTSCTGC